MLWEFNIVELKPNASEGKNHKMILEKFRSRRKVLSENYLRAPEGEFQKEVESSREVYLALMGSGVREQPLSEEEQDFLNGVLKQEFDQAKGLQYLFVMMLYCSPHQLPPKWRSRLSVPTWATVYLHAWFNRGIPPMSVSDESRFVDRLYEYAHSFPDSEGMIQKIRLAFSRLNGVRARDQYRHAGKQWFIPLFKARLVYTPVPKCACTSMKYFLFECERGIPYSRETVGNRKHIHQFYNTWGKIIKEYVYSDDWLKVLIVRDPVQRLISCYTDKVRSRKVLLSCQDELSRADLPVVPDFNVFVDNLELYRSVNGKIKHHSDPLIVFAKSPDLYDVVLNVTELHSLPAIVAERSACHVKNMPHKYKTRNILDIEDVSEQTVEKIHQFYARDYERFGRYF